MKKILILYILFTSVVGFGQSSPSLQPYVNDINTAKSNAAQALANTIGIVSGQHFINNYDASTNTPTLTTTPSTNGDYYIVTVAGTQSITGSPENFSLGDKIVSNGTAWKRQSAELSLTLFTGKNIYDKSKKFNGYISDSWNLVTTGSIAATSYVSALIPVTPSTQIAISGILYTQSGCQNVKTYNVSGASTGSGFKLTSTGVYTVPSGVYYIQLCTKYDASTDYSNATQVETGGVVTTYEAYQQFVEKTYDKYIIANKIKNYAGSKYQTIDDYFQDDKNTYRNWINNNLIDYALLEAYTPATLSGGDYLYISQLTYTGANLLTILIKNAANATVSYLSATTADNFVYVPQNAASGIGVYLVLDLVKLGTVNYTSQTLRINDNIKNPKFSPSIQANIQRLSILNQLNSKDVKYDIGTNLFDKNDVNIETSKAINSAVGGVFNTPNTYITATSSQAVSGYIKVEGLTTLVRNGTTNSSLIRVLFFDKNLNEISVVASHPTVTVPAGAVWARFNWWVADANTYQIEAGSTATAYQNFSRKIASTLLPSFSAYTQSVYKVVTPVYVIAGKVSRFYYNGFVFGGLTEGDDRVKGLSFDIVGVTNAFGTGRITKYKDGFDVRPIAGDVGTHTYAIIAYDDFGNQIFTSNVVINVGANTGLATAKNVLVLGDSFIDLNSNAGKGITYGIHDFVKNMNSLVAANFVGSRNTNFTGIKHEGRGGYQYRMYATAPTDDWWRFYVSSTPNISTTDVYSNNGSTFQLKEINSGSIALARISGTNNPTGTTLTRTSGTGDATITFTSVVATGGNPLWNNTTSSLDIANYRTNIGLAGTIDAVVMNLGANEAISATELTGIELTAITGYLNSIITAFLADNINTKFIVNLVCAGAPSRISAFTSVSQQVFSKNAYLISNAVAAYIQARGDYGTKTFIGQNTYGLSRWEGFLNVDHQKFHFKLSSSTQLEKFKQIPLNASFFIDVPFTDSSISPQMQFVGVENDELILKFFVNDANSSYDTYINGTETILSTKTPNTTGTITAQFNSTGYSIMTLGETSSYSSFYKENDQSLKRVYLNAVHPWVKGFLQMGEILGHQLGYILQ